MQRVCPAAGGVKAYLADPTMLLTDATRACPLCVDPHQLRRHGWYQRLALAAEPEQSLTILVLRLLCARLGRTVSLLPDFCLPGRQHGPAILGRFLDGWINGGLGMHAALKRTRPGAAEHSTAQRLLSGIRARAPTLRAYLSSVCHRAIEPPAKLRGLRRELAPIVLGLLAGFSDPASAFIAHGVTFHRGYEVGLA